MATKVMKIGLSTADKNTMSSQVSLATINKLIDAYSTSKQYEVGDYVNNAGIIYVCTEATSGAWDSTKWSVATLNQVIDKINSAAASVNNKAEKDGYYETFGYAREAGIAKNLQNDEGKLLDPDVDTSSGTTYADAPFVQRATAMTMKAYLDNELITVGSGYEQWRKEQAFSIVRNNKIQNGKFESTSGWGVNGGTISVSNNKATITSDTSSSNVNWGRTDISIINTHIYLQLATIKIVSATNQPTNLLGMQDATYAPVWLNVTNPVIGQTYQASRISTLNSSANRYYFQVAKANASDEVVVECSNVKLIDLTQWFASKPEIATALSGDAGIKWFLQNYPEALTLDYDEGTIVDTEDYEYQTTGINLNDEDFELGVINQETGENQSSSTQIRNKNYINVFPNTEYFVIHPDKGCMLFYYDVNYNLISNTSIATNSVFNTPSNCAYIRFYLSASYGTTYNNDVQICHHFTENSVENTYHKYEIFKDRVSWAFTSTGKGKSAGSVADTKDYVNKKNIVKVGQIDLGTLDYTYGNTEGQYCFSSNIPNKKNASYGANTSNLTCSKYASTSWGNNRTKDNFDMTIAEGGIYISIRNSAYNDAAAFKAAMSGVMLNYELATPIETDMQGDEYDTNIPENDYGVERKVSVSGNMFSGSATTIFYQDNVLRQIYNNKSAIDNLQEGLNTIEARIPIAPTTDGTYTLKAVVSNGVATYSWELDSQGA